MKTTSSPNIKFIAQDGNEFFSTLRQRVDAYFKDRGISRHANRTMVVKTAVLMAAYLLPFVSMLIWPLPFGVCLALWFVMGLAMAGNGMSVMHDANHGAYSRSERINRIVSWNLNLLGGSMLNWKMQHNILHHTFTNVDGYDEDIDNKVLLRFSPHSEQKPVHRYQVFFVFFFYGIMTLYWGLLKDFVQYIGYKKKGMNTNTTRQNAWWIVRLSLVKVIYFFVLLVLPVLLTSIPFWQVLTGFIVMHFTAGIILSVVFQLAHTIEGTTHPLPDETGSIENAWAIHQMNTTMNFSPDNRWLSWYVGGLNFQVEHHLFPKTCHVHYPAISPIVRQTAAEFGIPYLENRSFFSAFRSHLRLLKKYGMPPVDEIMG